MTRVLIVGGGLDVSGGISRYCRNLLLHMDLTRYAVTMWVAPPPADAPGNGPALRRAGVTLVKVPDTDRALFLRLPALLRAAPQYDIIHLMCSSKLHAAFALVIKCLRPRAKLIVHAHTANHPENIGWKISRLLYRPAADHYLACGVDAGRFMFGQGVTRRKNFAVACNAVDRNAFYPDGEAGRACRRQWGVEDGQRLLGFVGRFDDGKNVPFTLDVFAALYALSPDWRLMLVGDGVDRPAIEARIRALGLEQTVVETGRQNEIPPFMNAFDVFLLPSKCEGSPVTLIEAQGCGVPCYASTNVPREGELTPVIRFLPLADGPEKWAEQIDREITGGPHRDYWNELSAAGYELDTAGRRMEQVYDSLVNV